MTQKIARFLPVTHFRPIFSPDLPGSDNDPPKNLCVIFWECPLATFPALYFAQPPWKISNDTQDPLQPPNPRTYT